MKITKRQLKRIIKEEKRRLLEQDDLSYDDVASSYDAMAKQHMTTVMETVLELFVEYGSVSTAQVEDHLLQLNILTQDEIDVGFEELIGEY